MKNIPDCIIIWLVWFGGATLLYLLYPLFCLHLTTVREQLKELTKQYDKSENDLKALQSVGQVRNNTVCFATPSLWINLLANIISAMHFSF